MTLSSAFLWRFLDDVWDLLPSEDRGLFEAYWKAQLRAAGHIEQRAIESSLSQFISDVPVFMTERWGRFVMSEETCDLFKATDKVLLNGNDEAYLSKRDTVLYESLVVSSASGQIHHAEAMQFFDGSVRSLRYEGVIPGTVSVKAGAFEFTANRDYVVNHERGTIQALDEGRIPVDELVSVTYQHKGYAVDIDYAVDEVKGAITRTSGSEIPDGAEVHVTYTYNATATLPLQGSASVHGAILTDADKDFSALLPNRKISIADGPNKGTYSVTSVIDEHSIQTDKPFPESQDRVDYTINAFPHGVRIDRAVASIPTLQDRIDDPSVFMEEGVDYIVESGVLALRRAFPLLDIGPEINRVRVLWAEKVKIDRETPYRNFGALIGFYRENSEAYRQALQGLWYTFWTGSTPENIRRGLHILLGLPFARASGVVTRVDGEEGVVEIRDSRGQILSYSIPRGCTLCPEVLVGGEVERFDRLTDGVRLFDRNNDPGFVRKRLGRTGASRFLTGKASRGRGDTDETRALDLLEHHLFVPNILVEAITESINVGELFRFLDNMKPEWAEYVFAFAAEESDGFRLVSGEGDMDTRLDIDLTSTVAFNDWNRSYSNGDFIAEGGSGQILAGGTQENGNFRDSSKNFGSIGVKTGDTVQIENTSFAGSYLVVGVFPGGVLSLNIPDASISAAPNLLYKVVPGDRNLDDDNVLLGGEHVILKGSEYFAPSSLNTKTDIDFEGYKLSDVEVEALLLVDPDIEGGEVQGILDADVESGEISVQTPPSSGPRDHEIASAAIKRTENAASSVTDAYAI